MNTTGRNTKRGRFVAAFTAGAMLVTATVSLADDKLVYDGDLLDTDFSGGGHGNEELNLGSVCQGTSVPVAGSNFKLALHATSAEATERNGYINGRTVTFSVAENNNTDATKGTLAVTLPTATLELPADWESKIAGTKSDAVSGRVTVTVGSAVVPGTKSGTIEFQVSGPGWVNSPGGSSSSRSEGTVVRDATMQISWTVVSATDSACATADTTPPTLAFDATSVGYAPNGSLGWWKSGTAKVKVTATDASGVASIACTLGGTAVTLTNAGSTTTTRYGDVEMATDGSRQVSCTATDASSGPNVSSAATHQLKLDTVTPVISVTGPADGAKYLRGSTIPTAGCSTTDVGGSGVATPAAITSTAVDNSVVGLKAVTCGGGVDVAGNAGTAASISYTVVEYAVSFQQPIDGHGVRNIAKLGRVVPVKMTVTENGVAITGTTASPVSLRYVRQGCDPSSAGDTVESWSTSAENAGNRLAWDAEAQRWFYNLDTRQVTTVLNTCWEVEVYVGGTVGSNQLATGGLKAGSFKLQLTK